MKLLQLGEVFGLPVTDLSPSAGASRSRKWCPFRGSPCTKSGKLNPLGICSLTNGKQLATLCPVRFLQGNQVLRDVGRIAFGANVTVLAVPEVRVLEIAANPGLPNSTSKKVGKVDFLLIRPDANDQPTTDSVALEVQSVYMSGLSMRSDFETFLTTGRVPDGSARRPDYRSSIQKRLMPQLGLKMQAFRTWGKKFFVATDELFLATSHEFSRNQATSIAKSPGWSIRLSCNNRQAPSGTIREPRPLTLPNGPMWNLPFARGKGTPNRF